MSETPASAADLLTARYGTHPGFTPPAWNQTLSTQLAHRSVRRWLPREVDEATIRTLAAAAQSAPTSSNKQLVSVVAVRDPELRRRLGEVGGPLQSPHISTAPVVFVWLIDTSRIRVAVNAAQQAKPKIQYTALEYVDEAFVGVCDIGIAAQNAVIAAQSLGLGAVYLGSMRNDAAEVGRILGTPDHVVPFVGLEIGYPDPEEPAGVKPRIPQDAFLHWDTYDADRAVALGDYDDTLAQYFARYGKPSKWSQQLVSRVGPPAVESTKRHFLRRVFEKAGFRLG